MKRKTSDTPKIPSEKAPSTRAETKGILASTASNPSSKASFPSAIRTSNLSVSPVPAPLTPFQVLIEEWLTYCKAGGLSPKTIITYRDFVSKFYWWWTEHARKGTNNGKEPHPVDVTTKDVREFAAYLRTPLAFRWGAPVPPRLQTLSPITVSTYGRHIKVFFNWLEQEEYIDHTPINRSVKFTNKSKQDKVLKLVAQEELGKLFRFLNQPERLKSFTGARDLAIIALLLDSGIRLGELLSIRNCDLDLKAGRCTVNGKTGRRVAVFGAIGRAAISQYYQHPYHPLQHNSAATSTDAFWVTVDGMPLTFYGCQSLIRRLREESGVRFHAHQLRHTYATTMIGQGMNLYDLKGLMGHTDIKTTQIYLHDNVDRLSEVYRPHSPLNAIPGLSAEIKKSRGRPRKWE